MTEGGTEKMGRWIGRPYSPMNNMEVPSKLANDKEEANRRYQPNKESQMSSNQQATGNHYRELISEVLLRKGIATKEGWRRRRTKPETSPTTQQPTTVEETDK